MKKELNPKQKLFCIEYLKDFNGTRAYKTAYGGSDNVAKVNASRLLTKANIQDFLGDKAKRKLEKAEMGVDYVLEKLQQVIDIGMGEQEVELEEGKPKRILDLSNVNSALEKLGKYHKMYTDKIEQDTNYQIKIISYLDDEEG